MFKKFIKKYFFSKKNNSLLENKSLINLNYNEKILNNLNFDIEKINKILRENKKNYLNPRLSWHYHIFANFSSEEKYNILEIGTYDGAFTNFISKIFPNSKIFTIDLPNNNSDFINTYDRDSLEKFNEFIKIRKKNLEMNNIKFDQIDSFNLLEHFSEKKFDFIFIDGDHLNPQVTIDIFQSIKLLKKGGLIVTDDIVKDFNNVFNSLEKNAPYVDSQSYFTLERLCKRNLIENDYILKYTSPKKTKEKYKYLCITKLPND